MRDDERKNVGMLIEQALVDYSEAFAFIGNSLLKPMNQTDAIGLDPAFWAQFPDFESEAVADAVRVCADYAMRAQRIGNRKDAVTHESVEFTKLFVGPPRPAAAPWETFYRVPEGVEVSVGFGQATFEMRDLLREAGLELSNENRQYEDHIGIELLYLSTLCSRAAA